VEAPIEGQSRIVMIKKTTLLALLCAVILGGVVYYFDGRQGSGEKPAAAASKPAFSIQTSDISSITLSHPSEPNSPAIRLEKRGDAWDIVQPIETEADQSSIDGIVDQLVSTSVSGAEPGTSDRRKVYGLDPPQVSLEFQLRNGAKHTLLIGNKDFSGDSVYTIIDGGQSVSLLPDSLATSAEKSLDDLRDRAILHIDATQVSSFDLTNHSGQFAASKEKDQWKFTKPQTSLADRDATDSLLQSVANAKMASVADEKLEHLDRYGLQTPGITLTATDEKGMHATLLVGKKSGNAYFARDASRPMIFTISDDVYAKLAQKYADLRDKSVVHITATDIQQVQFTDSAGAVTLSRKKGDSEEWNFDAPDQQKGKSASGWKILDAVTGLRADQIIDHPSAAELKPLANPEVTVVLTDMEGKKTTVRFSKAAGDFVYAQASGSDTLYKLKKETVAGLDLKPADLAL
jgi:Domain of unknown function (DUF4340)